MMTGRSIDTYGCHSCLVEITCCCDVAERRRSIRSSKAAVSINAFAAGSASSELRTITDRDMIFARIGNIHVE